METVSIGVIAAGLNFIIKATEFTAHYAGVSHTIKQLQINVELADQAVNTANRLIRLKPFLDREHLVRDAQRSIHSTQKVLQLLQETIEACRKDIELNDSVGVGNRIRWVLYREKDFLDSLATLTNALGCLNRDILRMEAVPTPHLPSYGESAAALCNEPPGFPRSPMQRARTRAGHKLSNVYEKEQNEFAELMYVITAPAELCSDYERLERTAKCTELNAEVKSSAAPPVISRRRSNFI